MHLATVSRRRRKEERRKEDESILRVWNFIQPSQTVRWRWAIGYGYYIIFCPSLFTRLLLLLSLFIRCCRHCDHCWCGSVTILFFCVCLPSPERNSHHLSCAVVLISIANSPARFDVEQRRQTVEGRIQEDGKGVSIYGIRCCCTVHLYNRVWKEKE